MLSALPQNFAICVADSYWCDYYCKVRQLQAARVLRACMWEPTWLLSMAPPEAVYPLPIPEHPAVTNSRSTRHLGTTLSWPRGTRRAQSTPTSSTQSPQTQSSRALPLPRGGVRRRRLDSVLDTNARPLYSDMLRFCLLWRTLFDTLAPRLSGPSQTCPACLIRASALS